MNKSRLSADGTVYFCERGIKGGQGGTPLPTTSLQTKSESVIVGYTHSKNVVQWLRPAEKGESKWQKTVR